MAFWFDGPTTSIASHRDDAIVAEHGGVQRVPQSVEPQTRTYSMSSQPVVTSGVARHRSTLQRFMTNVSSVWIETSHSHLTKTDTQIS